MGFIQWLLQIFFKKWYPALAIIWDSYASYVLGSLFYRLAYSSHPSQSVDEVLLGKYGAVVAYEESAVQPESLADLPENVTPEKLPRQLCQHIIGLFID